MMIGVVADEIVARVAAGADRRWTQAGRRRHGRGLYRTSRSIDLDKLLCFHYNVMKKHKSMAGADATALRPTRPSERLDQSADHGPFYFPGLIGAGDADESRARIGLMGRARAGAEINRQPARARRIASASVRE